MTAAVTWLGHATVLIEIEGVRLLTDPVLGARVGPLVRSAGPAPTGVLGRLNGVLLSHLHADHVHLRSLRSVGLATPVIAPSGAGEWLARRGLTVVSELVPGEQTSVQGLSVRAVPAVHDGRRWPLGVRADAIGYLVGPVYFAGDTDLFDGMRDLRGSVEVALLPVWGWGFRLGPGHLDPERAARAASMIEPRLVIPIHWGTFALPWRARRCADVRGPEAEFAALVSRYASAVQVRVLHPGDRIELARD
jgi:L-ascorbate metabolism protein UlaG (beta-lactamase superfamily)